MNKTTSWLKQIQKNKGVQFYNQNSLFGEQTERFALLNFLYTNPLGKMLRLLARHRFMAKIFAVYQNSGLTKSKIQPFIERYKICMNDFVVPEHGYHSFNNFFTRALKPGARLIDQRDTVLVSPADAKCFVLENLQGDNEFFVKNCRFKLADFLKDSELAGQYEQGTMMVFRLAPYDYHRYHFPTDCFVQKSEIIHGHLESVNPITFATGLQPLVQNERHLITLQTKKFGDILMIIVGAMLVGKIVETHRVCQNYKKGEEAGLFEFGGSTVVLLFKKDMIKLRADLLKNSSEKKETVVKMGEAVSV
ncbi:archaetidylserine decarboxylase [Candidatus Babeliales bacterium]|nr:archaetidylserine decarboxylase [Candidatus Babeliales bacterium]